MGEEVTYHCRRRALDDYPEAMTVWEAAQVLRLSERLVYDLVRTGRLPSVRAGRRIIIHRDAVRRFLEGQ